MILNVVDGTCREYLAKEEVYDEETPYRFQSFGNDKIAYIHKDSVWGDGQAKLFDTVTEETIELSSPHIDVQDIRIEGNYVVWADIYGSQDNAEIFVHRISTGDTWNLSNHPSDQFQPMIDGTRVVWTDLRNGGGNYFSMDIENADVYMYDLADDSLARITDGAWIQAKPDISGDRIVWADYRDCNNPNEQADFSNVDVWMHDLATGQEHQITSFSGSETEVLISGDNVYYFTVVPGDSYFAILRQDVTALGL